MKSEKNRRQKTPTQEQIETTKVEKERSLGACSRRAFFAGLGAASALAIEIRTSAWLPRLQFTAAEAKAAPGSGNPQRRRNDAYQIRHQTALDQKNLPLVAHPDNGEERDYPYIANYSKGLPHNPLGEVDAEAYRVLLRAVLLGDDDAFERVPLGGVRPLRNPQAGKCFDLEGPDSHHLAMRPAPRIDGPENSAEMAELYWMALARDINFTEYDSSALISAACADLSNFSDYRGPKQFGLVTPHAIFRGTAPGDLQGPYVSQFLLHEVPYGTLTISQRQQTVLAATDYMTDPVSWLDIQNGLDPLQADVFDSTRRYIRNGRDLAAYVHFDALYEAYLNACLILLGMEAPLDPGNPYLSRTRTDAFGTFGGPHILSLVTEVATRALKAVWYQKWYVHRRLRPEEFGGRVHYHLAGTASYPMDAELLNSAALDQVYSRYGAHFLPQAYPEGCPLHPAYGSGHATVAGACVTVLKAWFDESYIVPNPVVPNSNGTALVSYTGPQAGALTVGGELNKLVANIASGRNFAGLHWRTDYSEALKLGEAVAIGILRDQRNTYREGFAGFSLTKFDGTTITV